jgi:hypothetical protein
LRFLKYFMPPAFWSKEGRAGEMIGANIVEFLARTETACF